MQENLEKTSICKDCGLVLKKPKVDYKHQFHCPRCNAIIYRFGQDYQTVLLFAITSIILFIPAIILPILSLEIFRFKTNNYTY